MYRHYKKGHVKLIVRTQWNFKLHEAKAIQTANPNFCKHQPTAQHDQNPHFRAASPPRIIPCFIGGKLTLATLRQRVCVHFGGALFGCGHG